MGSDYWYIGVLISSTASFMGTGGKLLLKYSHNVQDASDGESSKRSKIALWIGFACIFIFNPILDLVSYHFAEQSILSPLSALSILWATLFSPYFLQEKLTRRDMIGSALIIVGVVIVIVAGDHNSKEYSVRDVIDHYHSSSFVIYILIEASLFSAMIAHMVYGREGKLKNVCYGLIGGVIGGNFYMVKCTVVLFGHIADIWEHHETYFIFAGTIFCTVGGVAFLNKALKRDDAITVIPLYESALILNGSISAIAFWHAWDNFAKWQLALFPFGPLVSLGGVIILSTKPLKTKNRSEGRRGSLLPDDVPGSDDVELTVVQAGGQVDPSAVVVAQPGMQTPLDEAATASHTTTVAGDNVDPRQHGLGAAHAEVTVVHDS